MNQRRCVGWEWGGGIPREFRLGLVPRSLGCEHDCCDLDCGHREACASAHLVAGPWTVSGRDGSGASVGGRQW